VVVCCCSHLVKLSKRGVLFWRSCRVKKLSSVSHGASLPRGGDVRRTRCACNALWLHESSGALQGMMQDCVRAAAWENNFI
jgi:hypothetical protein